MFMPQKQAGFLNMRVAIYTVVLGGYDYLFPVPLPQKDADEATMQIDWILLSETKPMFTKGWQWRPLPEDIKGQSATERNRYCKFFPTRLFPDYDISVYIDANVALKRPISQEIVTFQSSGADIGLGYVNDRANIQEEAAFCHTSDRFGDALCAQVDAQVADYERRGLPAEHRLFQGRVIFRNHNSPKLGAAMQTWWDEFMAWSRRDQISLPLAIHQHGLRVHRWQWDHRIGDSFFHVARHKPKWAWLRPEAFIEEMRFSRPIWMRLYKMLTPFYFMRLLVRRFKYEKHKPLIRW